MFAVCGVRACVCDARVGNYRKREKKVKSSGERGLGSADVGNVAVRGNKNPRKQRRNGTEWKISRIGERTGERDAAKPVCERENLMQTT